MKYANSTYSEVALFGGLIGGIIDGEWKDGWLLDLGTEEYSKELKDRNFEAWAERVDSFANDMSIVLVNGKMAGSFMGAGESEYIELNTDEDDLVEIFAVRTPPVERLKEIYNELVEAIEEANHA